MGWRRGASEQFHVLGRIAASAGGAGDIPAERLAVLIDGVVGRHLQLGTISADDETSWRLHLAADPAGAAALLTEREQQLQDAVRRTASGNGGFSAAGRHEGEQLVASAIKAGKFGESRREFWLSRYRVNPQATMTTIEALQPLPPFIAAKGTTGSDETLVGGVSPRAALALGYAVRTEHPLGENLPGRVRMPPPQGPIHKISDRA